MLFIRNGLFWNTECPVFTVKILDGERNIIFTTEFFSSSQPNVTNQNVSFVYQQKLKKTLSAWGHAPSPPPLPPPPPSPGFSWTLKLLCFGILSEFFGIITDIIISVSVVVTPPYPSSFLWLQTELVN